MVDHLDPEVLPVLQMSLEERIKYVCSDSWIEYTHAERVLDALEDIFNYPRSIRMPNALIVGEPGNGKSTLAEEFKKRHPATHDAMGDPIVPVIIVHMPSKPSESEFYSQILYALDIAHRATDKPMSKLNQLTKLIFDLRTRVILIDEFHDLQHCSAREQRLFLAVLKKLTNLLKISIVGIGIRTSITVMHTDRQFSSRFQTLALPRWELNKDFRRLVASLERQLPLALPSNLDQRETTIKLFSLSEGTIGGLVKALEEATKYALRNKEERITLETLNRMKFQKLADYRNSAQEV